jgi:serine/threonine protein kinase
VSTAPESSNLGDLRTLDWERLQDLLDPFEAAWHALEGQAGVVELAGFLPPPTDPLRRLALIELIKADLEFRWRRGLPVGLDTYLADFPELGAAAALPPRLLYEEYRVRQRYGDQPPLADYQARFPEQFPDLQRLLKEEPLGTVVSDNLSTPMPAGSNTSGTPPAAGPQLLQVLGDYRLLHRIGMGAFGEVWKAEAPGGVHVALKTIIRPVEHELAQQERRALELIKQLRHPYLMSIQAFWVLESRLHVAMELADGSLRQRYQECRKQGLAGVPQKEMLGYLREAAEALDFLHREHVLHRDIKPENLLLLQGHVKVADIGLARHLQGDISMLNDSGSGTPTYMPPEMVTRRVCKQSDQYSLAVVYAEMRQGRPPFRADNLFELMQAHIFKEPDLEGLPEPERGAVRKALSKEHRERFRSCSDFAEALAAATAEPPPAPVPPSRTKPERRPRRLILLGATLVLILLAAAFGVLLANSYRNNNPPRVPFTLVPASVELQPGEEKAVSLFVQRDGQFRGPIELSFRDLPEHVAIQPGTIAADADHVQLTLRSANDVPVGPIEVKVHATADGHHNDGTLALVFLPPNITLLPGWAKPANAQVVSDGSNRKYYDRIDVRRGGLAVRFVLVPRAAVGDLPTYYIMEDKVSAGLFHKFAAADPRAVSDPQWFELASNHEANNPVLGVVAEDAHRCALWLGGLLPTIQQWEKAAGRYDRGRGRGPFREQADPNLLGIGRTGPMRLDEPTDDISHPYGLRHLSGNGRELTRNLADPNRGTVPVDDPQELDAVSLRGRSFRAPQPLLFRDLEDREQTLLGDLGYRESNDETGFRVVLEP